jgi:hypothetical protein
MSTKKKCNKCKETKDLSQYYAMGHGKHGVKAHCISCEKDYREKHRKDPMPKEGDPYVINNITVQNYFYLHFGFTDRIPVPSEYATATKYTMQPIQPNRRDAQ